jgi:hypothetical protein
MMVNPPTLGAIYSWGVDSYQARDVTQVGDAYLVTLENLLAAENRFRCRVEVYQPTPVVEIDPLQWEWLEAYDAWCLFNTPSTMAALAAAGKRMLSNEGIA